jgi:DNA-binding NarL/FixJ family response regulator
LAGVLKHSKPKQPVLVLSMTKESASEELVGAVKKIVQGGRYVSPSLAEKMEFYLTVA